MDLGYGNRQKNCKKTVVPRCHDKSYCWWKKSCTSQYAGYHIIYKIYTLQVVLAHLSSGHVTLFDLFACCILGMIIFLNPSEGEARIPKTSSMGDIFSAMKMDPYHSTSWNVSQGFWWNLGPLLTWLSRSRANTQHFSPQAVILRVPQQPPAAQKPPGVEAGWNRKDVRVRFKKKNKGPLGGGNSNISYFHPKFWGRFPFWLIFFKWVETTN